MAEDSNLTRRVAADGVELSVLVHGIGPPVVFLHGFPENARGWRHQVAAVTKAGFSAWAPDLRGYNRSERPQACAAYHLRHLMADVVALVRATGSPRAHLVGHDWGGIIAWSVAGHYPEMIDSLVILNAPHMKIYTHQVWRSSQWLRSWYVGAFMLPRVPEWLLSARDFALLRQMFDAVSGRRSPFTPAEIDAYVEQFRAPGALTAALNYYRANANNDGVRLAAASRVRCPTLVIWGEKDVALSEVLLEDLESVAPNVRIHRLAEAGHWVHHEARDEVNRLLVGFLATHRGHDGS